MKTLPPALSEHLATGATTLCWCWRLRRRDGATLGFTDHDRDIVFDATNFEAAAGFEAGEIRDSVGLSVDNLDVTSALSSERLAEDDLAAGLYDDARVEIFRVNWQDPSGRVLMRVGSLGEVRRAGTVFAAEVRGLSHYLQQTQGRVFQYTCDADLGDRRCGVDTTSATYRGMGAVAVASSTRRFTASGLGEYPHDWFSRGLLTFTSGAATGQAVEVKAHTVSAGVVTMELWQPARRPLVAGQTFHVTAGCDKNLETCREKFANAINFRGFPHMPGNDLLTRVARSMAE
ncbi:MAG: beta-tubulin [Hyphomicrobium sp.]|nr:beta-tubulin [Hyphomicrobium sp.]PPC83414.1 MAG: beta tubulin [Hyphomicrobium sp.]